MNTRKLKRLTTIALLAIGLSSCSNETGSDDGNSKFIRITEYPSNSTKENFHADLTYDNMGRLTLYNEVSDPGVPVFGLSFQYSGADTKPISAHYDVSDHYFTYNNAGKLIKDSCITNDGASLNYTEVKNISYPSSSLILVNRIVNTSGPIIRSLDSLTLDSRGNVTASNFYAENSLGNLYLALIRSWEYDDKPNPFGALNIFPVLQPGFNDIYFSRANNSFLQKNNCLRTTLILYHENGSIIDNN
ncbi:MAG: hypothetical protein EOO03_11580, partial [Chitinophagaceae bacterium]